MIIFDRFTLNNGLKVIVHQDNTTPLVAINVLYNIGAKDEHPEKTGFAHLFEHLMFGGSVNIPSYDSALQKTGGENNAFTNNDYTDYYLTLPKENLETGFWLESDRMLCLDFSLKNLKIQRNVVIEEFNQRYLNQPYGDIWLLLCPLAYKVHPYRWATIGKDISHIQNATLEDVKEFFFKHYAPNNAILVVAGNIKTKQIEKLANKWFSPIKQRKIPARNLPQEPAQKEKRMITIKRDVPFDAIYKTFHMCSRTNYDYHATDLISDILSNGKSSRLYQALVKNKKLFSEINAYITGYIDAGLLIITGKLIKGVPMEMAENAIEEELTKIKREPVPKYELNKVKNQVESSLVFSEAGVLNKTMNLAYHELLGNAENINEQVNKYLKTTVKQIHQLSNKIFNPSNSSTIYYFAQK